MSDNSLYQKHICDDAVLWKSLLQERTVPVVESELIEDIATLQLRGFSFEEGDVIRSRRSGIVQPVSEVSAVADIQQLCENILDGIYSEDFDDDVMIDHVPARCGTWDVFAPKGQIVVQVRMQRGVFASAVVFVPQKKYTMELYLDIMTGKLMEMKHKEGLFAFEQSVYDMVVPFWSELLRNAYRAWSIVKAENMTIDFVMDAKGKAYIYDLQRQYIVSDTTKTTQVAESFEDALHLARESQAA